MRQTALAWWRRFEVLPVPRPVRFFLVGLSGVGVNMGALWVLLTRAGLPAPPAGALAIELSVCSNFLLNDVWTFGAGRKTRTWWTRVSAFHATAAVAAGVNLSLFLLLASVAGLHYLLANLIAIAAASVINFAISASWTWRAAQPLSHAPAPSIVGDLLPPAKRIVVIPTYNEGANIRPLLGRILSLDRGFEVLVVDDASPDGTGNIVAAMATRDPRVHLIHRGAKLGIASAYVSGFQTALEMGADFVYQMDADFSHNPLDLRRLARAAAPNSVVIGSRYVPGGWTPGWSAHRVLVSRAVNLAARLLLGIPVHDVSGGFKCWARQALASLRLDSIRSTGFAFQIEMNYLAWRSGFSLVEVPITFEDRKAGRSKASLAIAIEMAAVICRLFLNPPKCIGAAPQHAEGVVMSADIGSSKAA